MVGEAEAGAEEGGEGGDEEEVEGGVEAVVGPRRNPYWNWLSSSTVSSVSSALEVAS